MAFAMVSRREIVSGSSLTEVALVGMSSDYIVVNCILIIYSVVRLHPPVAGTFGAPTLLVCGAKRRNLGDGLGQSANFAPGYLRSLLILRTREIGDSPRLEPQAYFAPQRS